MARLKYNNGSEWVAVDATGVVPEVSQQEILSKISGVADIDEFREYSKFNVTLSGGTQGVAVDGNHVYVSTGFFIYKFTKAGTLVTSRDVRNDGSAAGHIGGLYVKDGFVYAVVNNYPNTPVVNNVSKWDASTLAFIEEFPMSVSEYNADITYHDGLWWLNYYDGTVRSYNESFVQQTVYNLPFSFDTGTFNFDGLDWIGNCLYMNPHDGMVPGSMQEFFFDGNKFIHTRAITKPINCTQGISYDSNSGNMYFITRQSGTNAVVAGKPSPSDLREKRVGYSGVGSSHSTTSTSYVEDSIVTAEIFVRRGDIVRAELSGIFTATSGGGVKAYVEPSSNSGVAMTLLTTPGSLRTSGTSSNGQSLCYSRLFRAEADGVARFSQYWASVTGSSVTSLSGSIILTIEGRSGV